MQLEGTTQANQAKGARQANAQTKKEAKKATQERSKQQQLEEQH